MKNELKLIAFGVLIGVLLSVALTILNFDIAVLDYNTGYAAGWTDALNYSRTFSPVAWQNATVYLNCTYP